MRSLFPRTCDGGAQRRPTTIPLLHLAPDPGFEMRDAEKLVFVRDETTLFQRVAEVSGLLVRDDRAGVTIRFQKLPDHFVEQNECDGGG
jgi:hypothetical protein